MHDDLGSIPLIHVKGECGSHTCNPVLRKRDSQTGQSNLIQEEPQQVPGTDPASKQNVNGS